MNAPIRIGPSRLRGFSLIEALIAVVVLATGLLALAALQGSLIRSSADAKARSQVAAFAEGLMDARRINGFGDARLDPGTASPKLATAAQLVAAAQAMGAVSVSETTTVTQYVANASGVFPSPGYSNKTDADAALLAAGTGAATFKRVETALRWTDASGSPTERVVRLSTDLSPLALKSSKVLVSREPPDDSGLRPIVRRPLDPANEGMIPLALGDGQDTAATNPKPVLVGNKNDTLVSDTRFEVLTFSSTEPGITGFARFNKRIQTAVIGCQCQTGTGGFPTSGPDAAVNTFLKAARYRPAYWDGERYAEPRPIFTGVDSSPADVAQSPLCDVCCRDHKDPDLTEEVLYKPWPRTAETSHEHYRIDNTGTLVLANGGNYIEACRVIRVDGIWRVTPDPRLDDLAMVPTKDYTTSMTFPVPPVSNRAVGVSPLLSDAGKNGYTNFLFDFIGGRYVTGGTPNVNFPDATRYTMQSSAGINAPEYVPLSETASPPDKRWLHTRGVFFDFMVLKARERVQKAKDDCAGTSALQKAQCVLPFLPLAAINVTELARWTGVEQSGNAPEYGSTPVNFAQTRLRRHNSGIALFPAISPDDDNGRLFDEQRMVLLPPSQRTGQWLNVSDANGVIFGNLNNPTRGAATVGGGGRFNVTWAGVSAAANNEKGDDPVLVTVPSANFEIGCKEALVKNTSNPYACTTGTFSSVKLALSRFNFKVQPNQNQNSNPCNSAGNAPKVPKQAICVAHTLTSVVVDGTSYTPAAIQYTLISGVGGKPSAKRTMVLPSVKPGPYVAPITPSAVTMNFTSTTTNAVAVCDTTASPSIFVDWSCEL